MKIVRIENGMVAEIIPEYALPVAKWYGEEFAAQCVEASDDVDQNWTYDAATNTFSPPKVSETTIDPKVDTATTDVEAQRDEMLLDLAYRVAMIESGGATV